MGTWSVLCTTLSLMLKIVPGKYCMLHKHFGGECLKTRMNNIHIDVVVIEELFVVALTFPLLTIEVILQVVPSQNKIKYRSYIRPFFFITSSSLSSVRNF